MKKYWIVALALFFAASTAWAAPDREGAGDIGLNVWGVLPTDSGMTTGAYIGGSVAYGINPNWAVGAEIGYFQSNADLNINVPDVSGDLGDLRGIPLFFDIIYRYPVPDRPITPYGVLGLGGIFWHFDENKTIKEANSGINITSNFAAKFGLGVDWFVSDNIIINFEGAYVWTPAELTSHNSEGTTIDKSDASYFNAGGGIKYVFS